MIFRVKNRFDVLDAAGLPGDLRCNDIICMEAVDAVSGFIYLLSDGIVVVFNFPAERNDIVVAVGDVLRIYRDVNIIFFFLIQVIGGTGGQIQGKPIQLQECTFGDDGRSLGKCGGCCPDGRKERSP